jgi:hypothetical protein
MFEYRNVWQTEIFFVVGSIKIAGFKLSICFRNAKSCVLTYCRSNNQFVKVVFG